MGDCHGAVGHGAPPCRGQRPQCLPAADGQKVVALARDGFARDGSGVDHRKYGALTGTYMGNAYGLKKKTPCSVVKYGQMYCQIYYLKSIFGFMV